MKQHKVIISLLLMVAIGFASIIPATAIGFIAEEVYESIFVIQSGNSLGSGFAMGANCVVTNAHVIDNKNKVTIRTYSGDQLPATVVGMDQNLDIAVLRVENVTFRPLQIADLETQRIGDDVYAIGAPKSMAYTLTKGVLSAKERMVGSYSYIQTDAAINEGNSGGPLLNDLGEVLGMNTMKMVDSEGLGLAIPITRICQYLQTLGYVLDETGGVTGLENPAAPTTPHTDSSQPQYTSPVPNVPVHPSPSPADDTISGLTLFLIILSSLSVAINIVLLICLLWKKNKNQTVPYDPRDRTDFDIDILE